MNRMNSCSIKTGWTPTTRRSSSWTGSSTALISVSGILGESHRIASFFANIGLDPLEDVARPPSLGHGFLERRRIKRRHLIQDAGHPELPPQSFPPRAPPLRPPLLGVGIPDRHTRLVLPKVLRDTIDFQQVLFQRAQIPIRAPIAQPRLMRRVLLFGLDPVDKPGDVLLQLLERLGTPPRLHLEIKGDEMPEEPDFLRLGPESLDPDLVEPELPVAVEAGLFRQAGASFIIVALEGSVRGQAQPVEYPLAVVTPRLAPRETDV